MTAGTSRAAGSGPVRTVVKVGGGLLSQAGAFDLVTGALAAFATGRRALIVPGGGPFAAAVRELARRIKLGDEAAHWMAVLGMDQYAHALVGRIPGAELVEQPADVARALDAGAVPVLAPYHWLRTADAFPHSWGVTSDSIAAWVAGVTGASRVVLIKPARGGVPRLVDAQFLRSLPPGVDSLILTPHELDKLGDALGEGPPSREARQAGRRS
jgi:5-(aminomethyl)-3-furanmethanol phosphate kinase